MLCLGTWNIYSSLICGNKDEADDKGFQEEEMECASGVAAESLNTYDSVNDADIKPDERLLVEIEKTFREIASNSTVGRILCNEER